jgi:hypothetical protein
VKPKRIGALFAAVAVVSVTAAAADARESAPLRLEARTATGLYSDGQRFAVISRDDRLTILDTFTRKRRTLAGTGCRVGGVQFGQTQVSSGRALLNCPAGPALLSLATGSTVALPTRLDFGGIQNPAFYTALGRHWAVDDAGSCGGVYCSVYVNLETGEQRVKRRSYDDIKRSFLDLDDPELAQRTLCRPHRGVPSETQRTYERPYLLDGGVLRRCGSRRAVRRLPEELPDLMNLSASWLSWGNPFPDSDGRAYLFDLRWQRLFSWRVARVGRRKRSSAFAVHTRREIFVAATLTINDEGDPLTVRVYRAPLPKVRP